MCNKQQNRNTVLPTLHLSFLSSFMFCDCPPVQGVVSMCCTYSGVTTAHHPLPSLGEGLPGPAPPRADQEGFDGYGEDLQVEGRLAEAGQGAAIDGGDGDGSPPSSPSLASLERLSSLQSQS